MAGHSMSGEGPNAICSVCYLKRAVIEKHDPACVPSVEKATPEQVERGTHGGRPARKRRGGGPRCAAHVMAGFFSHQCERRGVVEEGGYTWCRAHAPTLRLRRSNGMSRGWGIGWDARTAAYELADAVNEAEEAVADEAIACLHQTGSFDRLMELAAKLETAREKRDG